MKKQNSIWQIKGEARLIIWQEILKPISLFIDTESTIGAAIRKLSDSKENILFVVNNGIVVGYSTIELLMEQLAEKGDLSEIIQYKNNILKVPQFSPIEFFHNVSLIIGEDSNGQIVGYTTMEEAQDKINEIQLKDLNLLLNGAGVGIIRTNINFEIEFINETAENILGFPSSFLLSRNYKTLLNIEKDLNKVMEGETLVSVNSSVNFKQISGNFYPLRMKERITGLVHIFFLREVFEEAVQEVEIVSLYS